jgi:hypothetical protein
MKNKKIKLELINKIIIVICLILLIMEFVGHRHGETKIEDFPFFPAIFGFLSFALIVEVGKRLRTFLMRKEDYYD